MRAPAKRGALRSRSPFGEIGGFDDAPHQSLSGGLFRYTLTVNNPQAIIGLNIPRANTLFGLYFTSKIQASAGWNDFAPIAGVVDDLNYFALGSGVPVGGSLSGFQFDSSTNPEPPAGHSVTPRSSR